MQYLAIVIKGTTEEKKRKVTLFLATATAVTIDRHLHWVRSQYGDVAWIR